MIFRILAGLIFVIAIAGSFWLAGQQRSAPTPTTVETAAADLGYSARDAVLVETGDDGMPMYTLNADVIRQRPEDGVEFQQVRMTFRDANGQEWHGRADSGRLDTETGKVDLQGDVQADGLLPGSAEPVNLSTEQLDVDTRDSILATDQSITLTSPFRTLKSTGMVATLKDNHLVLQSNVRGTFTP